MSGRELREAPRRIMDEAARQRRQRKALEMLEQDNHIEEPNTDLKATKKPKFDSGEAPSKFKKRKRLLPGKSRIRKTLDILLDEEQQSRRAANNNEPSYFTAQIPPSRIPPRKFCSVCGFIGIYSCVTCGLRYCCIKCLDVHKDTRCMKWVV